MHLLYKSVHHRANGDCSCDPGIMVLSSSCMSCRCGCGVKLATSKRDTQTSVHDLMIWLFQICGFFSSPESFDSEGHKMRRRYTVFKPERKSLAFVQIHVTIWEWKCILLPLSSVKHIPAISFILLHWQMAEQWQTNFQILLQISSERRNPFDTLDRHQIFEMALSESKTT